MAKSANRAAREKDSIAVITDVRLNDKLTDYHIKKRAEAISKDKHYTKDIIYFIQKGEIKKYNRP